MTVNTPAKTAPFHIRPRTEADLDACVRTRRRYSSGKYDDGCGSRAGLCACVAAYVRVTGP